MPTRTMRSANFQRPDPFRYASARPRCLRAWIVTLPRRPEREAGYPGGRGVVVALPDMQGMASTVDRRGPMVTMHVWNWLLLAMLIIVLLLCWRVSQELRDTRRRASKLTRRVKRLRQLIMLDRLDRLEREVRDIEDVIIRHGRRARHSEHLDSTLASYVATCRGFVQRCAEEGKSRDQADDVVRIVLGHLVQNNPGQSARLGEMLSREEHDRWLK